jgi:hypothetical protein
MTASNPLELLPEGKMKECSLCPWASRCADVSVAGVPQEVNELSDDDAETLESLCREERELAMISAGYDGDHALVVEKIKQFLREHNTRKHKSKGCSVSYFSVSGKATLDTQAVENAGIDLKPFYKTGKPGERLVIRHISEEV